MTGLPFCSKKRKSDQYENRALSGLKWKQEMNWSDASISEKAIRLVAIAIGTIFLRYQISLDEGTVFDVILMISAWCLLLAGMFLFRAKKQFWPVLIGIGGCFVAIISAI